MRFHTEHLVFNTREHRQYISTTGEVNTALKKSNIQEGMILVSAMHITAGVWVNDAEDGLLADIDDWLEQLVPYRLDYRHHRPDDRAPTPQRVNGQAMLSGADRWSP
jgi:thiamine phosphate synthase YjbQ (UPF0047 family)